MDLRSEETLTSLPRDKLIWNKHDQDVTTDSYIGSDVHLHSLGLSVDSGKPRFKLNEECSSLAINSVSLLNFQNITDFPSSQSFVVLSHPSLEMVQAQSLANYIEIQEKRTYTDYNTVISSMSPSEIENKLTDMLHENLKLKKTLTENNLAMKKQFNSLATWQDAILSLHENHKQKFNETRELIDHLKTENLKLQTQLSENHFQAPSLCQFSGLVQMTDYVGLIENKIPQEKLRQKLIDRVKPHYENMGILDNFVSFELSEHAQLRQWLRKCTDILQNLESYNNESLEIANTIVMTCKNVLIECHKKLVHEQSETIADSKKWIKIKNQLEKFFLNYVNTLCELEELKVENTEILINKSRNLEEKHQREEEFLQSKATFEEEMRHMSLEKLSLIEERKSLEKFRETLLTNQESLNIEAELLKLEKLNLLQEKTALDRQSKLYEEQEKSWLTEKKNSIKISAELTEKIMNLEEQLKKKNELTFVDKENLMVLRAQLDIYRTDFEQEKAARKNLIREKNKLIEQIQSVTMQNKELRNDIDKLKHQIQYFKEHHDSSSSLQQETWNPETTDTSVSTAIQIYACPMCARKFSSYEPLEEHADTCIRLTEQN